MVKSGKGWEQSIQRYVVAYIYSTELITNVNRIKILKPINYRLKVVTRCVSLIKLAQT